MTLRTEADVRAAGIAANNLLLERFRAWREANPTATKEDAQRGFQQSLTDDDVMLLIDVAMSQQLADEQGGRDDR